MSSKPERKRSKVDDDDGVFDDNDDDDDDDDQDYGAAAGTKPAAAKKRKTKSFIDDAAEESGEEGGGDDDDEDEDDDDENDDYIKDGFVVDEDEDDDGAAPKKKDDLEDSDEDSDDDERDDSRLHKVRKMRTTDRLDDDDLALIKEAQGIDDDDDIMPEKEIIEKVEKPRERVVAANEAELRRSLFYDSGEDEKVDDSKSKAAAKAPPAKVRKAPRVEQYDEDGMDDFIEDDIGDQEIIRMADRKGGAYDDEAQQEINEAQLHEASEIFGTDYLEFMQEEDENAELDDDEEELLGKSKYRERGVGVQYGVESDEEEIISDDDDDDLFGDDDDDDNDDNAGGLTAQQKAEALRLKREKRTLAKAERRRQVQMKKSARRKAQLRRAFEPVQLVENFCTERDDDIRQKDVPERMFDWKAQFHGAAQDDSLNATEEEQARWIAQRIPAIAAELSMAGDSTEKERLVLVSIANALRYMHRDKLEPAFIKRYRKDYVVSVAVQNNLDSVMDENSEFDRMVEARDKVNFLLDGITKSINADASVGADAQKLVTLNEELADAQKKLEETAKQENQVKAELAAVSGNDDDDDDDELFGDDDDDDKDHEEKKKEKLRLESHLVTIQSLLEARADKVSQLETRVQLMDAQNRALNDPGPVERCAKKMRRECLWNIGDYTIYLSQLSEGRHILDVNTYLNLVKEGNDAIRKKELPLLTEVNGGADKRRRSRRFDRDFYRTCVSEGLRDVCYRFLLSPNRVGIKLEETIRTGSFDYSKTMIGEDGEVGAGDPMKWVPPTIPTTSPDGFATDLIGSGELVLLSSNSRGDPDASEAKDPLRGCRYVAAMELAYEPRVRRYLRDIYRRFAVLSTSPTAKGRDEIDAFHDYYGLHLIKSKPVSDHFAADERESFRRQAGLSPLEINELSMEMKKKENHSCLQYLNILKAESTGDIAVHIHLPLIETSDKWYAMTDQHLHRNNQDLRCLFSELLKVYMPTDGDTPEWEGERKKVLHFALTTFLLPQFETELRKDLREAAMKFGVIDASENLREIAMEGPYRPAAILHTENRFLHPTGLLPIVGVCCANDGRDSTYMASVNAKGESQDFLAIPSGVRVDAGKMREKIILFLIQSRPSAIVVGTSGGFESRAFQRKMVDLVAEAVKRWANRDIQGDDEDDEAFDIRRAQFRQLQSNSYYDDEDDDEWKCNVELINDNVSQLFGRSVRGKKEFPDYAENLKCAISLARHAKDPLAELTYAWSVASDAGMFGTELLFLNIHSAQQLLPKTLLLRQYERVLCSVVADVGVSLNLCCAFDHLRGLLMLTPGLGPRKGANLKQTVSQMDGIVSRRRDLLEKRLLGPIVYNNSIAFLRIQEVDNNSDQFYFHPLDATRLHPDVYLRNNWAIKIAFDALEREDPKSKEATAIKAIRDVMDDSSREIKRLLDATEAEWRQLYGPTFNKKDWDPRVNVPSDHWRDKVDDLDLETFAAMNENNGHGRWHSHLEMIKWEFRLPFADPRKPMGPLSGDKLFRLITGENDQSIRPGKELTGKVLQNGDFGSRVKLEGDIAAFISLRNMSDEHVEIADDYVSPGQVVTAIVTEVKKDHMTVDLSLKMEDFRKRPSSWERPQSLPALDIYFDITAASKIEETNSKNREARIEALLISLGNKSGGDGDASGPRRRGRVVRRACNHPAFINARNDEVDRSLREAGAAMVGEALIRPSNKSSDSLAIHWVVKEGHIKVIEVLEEGKETDASIGTVLKVKGEKYGSIDELLGRYIAPMNDFVEELVNHRKFMDLLEDEVDDKLKAMKKEQPRSIPYALCWMEMHPGYASLRYVSTANPRSHAIGISPSGYVWRETCYPNLDLLLNAFKKNPQGTTKNTAQATVAQNLPTDKPAPKKRWGEKAPLPTIPPIPQSQTGWNVRPPPPTVPPISVSVQPMAQSWDSAMPLWGQAQAAPRPPPNLPPPPSYVAPPSIPRPPPPLPPPRPRPPPPAVGTYIPQQQVPQPLPPLPPPPAFAASQNVQSQGRGRGRTLPAWMSK